MKTLLKFFLLLLFQISLGQDSDYSEKFVKVDSLINLNQLVRAKIELDAITKKNRFRKNSDELRLEALFRQAVILDRRDISSVESLKILFETKDEAEELNMHSLVFRIHLMIALGYEKSKNLTLTKKYLDNAAKLHAKYNLEKYYSTYCIRKSSYLRFLEEWDSSHYYAKQANHYAKKFRNEADLIDSFLLLGHFANEDKNYLDALKYNFKLLEYAKKIEGYYFAVIFNNISRNYLKMNDYKKALAYNDSALTYYNRQTNLYKPIITKTRYEIYEAQGMIDSAYKYFKIFHKDNEAYKMEEDILKVKELEEKYQNTKKEAVIKTKNQQMIFIGSFLGLIIIGSIILYLKNRKIRKQNKIIGKQLQELSKTLDQKKVLLSELQHRVKNNLQHVISILEIQKESVNYNNIEELLRSNQNRIHSMALLHKKLNVDENVNEIDLKKYILELSELVKESYDTYQKKIKIIINCEIETFSIEKALPLGLILVELISNSMKHAFKNQKLGTIKIELLEENGISNLYYSDNGSGFDFTKSADKGLGVEITKGLIQQLNGTIKTKSNNGFELNISFLTN